MAAKRIAACGGPYVPADLLNNVGTLTGAVEALANQFPDHQCLTVIDRYHHEQQLNFGQLWTRAREVQAALVAHGVEPGRIVLLALPTGPEIIAAYTGAMLAGSIPGLIATPSNRFADRSLYTARLNSLAEHAHAQALYVDEEVAAMLPTHGTPAPGRPVVLTPSTARSPQATLPITHAQPHSTAVVQYSSGSTGAPKGVLLSHHAVLNNIRAMRDGLGLCAEDVSVNWIPLYHDMGLIDAFLLPLLIGCQVVLLPTMDFMRDPSLWLWAIERYRGTLSIAPNFAYALCAKRIPDDALSGLDLSSWRIALNASEPIIADTLDAFTRRFATYGLRPEAMTPAWGLAEGVCVITARPVHLPARVETIDRNLLTARNTAQPTVHDGLPSVSCGPCLPESEIEIRDADGHPVPERAVGTIWLKGNSLFSGYHNDPQITAEVLRDGWLNTGDRGYLVHGELYFVSREKDLIVIGGEKYAPHDLEAAMNRVSGVRAGCAVAFGVLNEERGTEEVAAVVETRVTGDQSRADLRAAIRAEVLRTTGLGIRHVILVPPGGVEKTTSGKLARRATQNRYADQLIG